MTCPCGDPERFHFGGEVIEEISTNLRNAIEDIINHLHPGEPPCDEILSTLKNLISSFSYVYYNSIVLRNDHLLAIQENVRSN